MKTIEELKKLNTKNLIRLYKAERGRFYYAGLYKAERAILNGESVWGSGDENRRKNYEEWFDYIQLIKSELNTREHITK